MYKGHAYVIKNLEGNMHGMLEFSPDKMPPDHGAASKRDDDEDGHAQRSARARRRRQHDAARAGRSPRRMKPAPPKARRKEPTINLIVAYTKKAASHYTDIVKDLIDVAIAETNQSFKDSGAGNVHVKLVHAYETDYVEKGSHFDHVYRFRNKGDGYMDEIHDLRDKYGADVAVLVVDDPMGCGLSIRVAAEARRRLRRGPSRVRRHHVLARAMRSAT